LRVGLLRADSRYGCRTFFREVILDSPYSALPHHGPIKAAIGHALILLFEPHQGHEHAYNRWYEDDHFYVAGMAAPWAFAGRRWVAPRTLQTLRLPADSKLVEPLAPVAI